MNLHNMDLQDFVSAFVADMDVSDIEKFESDEALRHRIAYR